MLRVSCSIWNSFLPSFGSTIHWKRHSLASVSMVIRSRSFSQWYGVPKSAM